jgi:hypothetical protein
MAISDKAGSKPERAAEIRTALQFFTEALQIASKSYSATLPDQARAAVRIALVGVIKLISDLYPNEPSLPRPLNQLLQDLVDLDRGKVALLFQPAKVTNRPPTALSEDLFRALVAASMTLLMDGTEMRRDEAARDVARRLSKMGAKHSSGKLITVGQIAKWREKMMTELSSESLAVARYEFTLRMLRGMEPSDAVTMMLDSLPDLSPANFPKKPPA